MLKKPENMNTRKGPLPIAVTGANFAAEVLECPKPVLVEFWAPWSRPCRVLDAVFQQIAQGWGRKIKAVKVNADDCLDLSLMYEIHSVPTVLCFVQGNPSRRIIGTASKEAILDKIKPFCDKAYEKTP